MKKITLILSLFSFLLTACSNNPSNENNKQVAEKPNSENNTQVVEDPSNENYRQVVENLCKGTDIILVDQVDTVGPYRIGVLDSLISKDAQNTTIIEVLINSLGEFMLNLDISSKGEVLDYLTGFQNFSRKNMIIHFEYNDGTKIPDQTRSTPIQLVKEIGGVIVDIHKRRNSYLSEVLSKNADRREFPFIIITDEITWGWCNYSYQLDLTTDITKKPTRRRLTIEEYEKQVENMRKSVIDAEKMRNTEIITVPIED